MANHHPTATQEGGYVPTYARTDVTDGRSVPSERAPSAPFGSVVVAEYVNAGGKADRTELAILGRNAKLLRDRGASDSDILAAVREFAQTKRWPRYVSEWTTEKQIGDDIARHQREKKSDRKSAQQTMRRLGEAMKAAGL